MPGLHPALGTTPTPTPATGASPDDSDSLFSSADGITGRAAEEKGVSPAGESGASSQGKSRGGRAAGGGGGEAAPWRRSRARQGRRRREGGREARREAGRSVSDAASEGKCGGRRGRAERILLFSPRLHRPRRVIRPGRPKARERREAAGGLPFAVLGKAAEDQRVCVCVSMGRRGAGKLYPLCRSALPRFLCALNAERGGELRRT